MYKILVKTTKKTLKTTDKKYQKLFFDNKKITKFLSSWPDPGSKITKLLVVGRIPVNKSPTVVSRAVRNNSGITIMIVKIITTTISHVPVMVIIRIYPPGFKGNVPRHIFFSPKVVTMVV